MRTWIGVCLVAAGGALGAVARLATSELCRVPAVSKFARGFPLSTLIVNVVGCFLIGVLMAFVRRGQLSEEWRLFLVTGGLGALTTFSAFGFETFLLARSDETGLNFAFANIAGNVLLSLLAVWVGWRICS